MILTTLLLVSAAAAQTRIVTPPAPSALEQLAAREVRRYHYLRTGRLLPIVREPSATDAILFTRNQALGAEHYLLKAEGRRVTIAAGDDIGALYAAYRLAERWGVRFYIHGDVIPDTRLAALPAAFEERGAPLFEIRGIQPFHDFPEGPDWWNQDDYLAYVAQLPKLRMNFIGLHTYPEGGVGPEPAVWIGQEADLGAEGQVRSGYRAQWANTMRQDMWGYAPMKTSEFSAGADQLFERDEYGPDVMEARGDHAALFNRTGQMLRTVFAEARALGVKTCIGTETPLTIPKDVAARLAPSTTVKEIYKAIFRRIAEMYPPDYYWLWTPENWTWGGNKPEQFAATLKDIQSALDALADIGKPFRLATSGWVLGPQNDRAALDRFLPKDSPMSCINRKVGHASVEPGFANVSGRPKWAIPWVENDPNLIAPQPWAGRMRYDAVDARRLGCTGLLGIHWRTRILAPNFAALAAAAWDQAWVPRDFDTTPIPPGRTAADPSADGTGHEHPLRGRSMPVEEFYIDFARANFGDSVADAAGKLFTSIDGVQLPEPSTWIKGPGGIRVEKTPWSQIKPKYRFVDELAGLRNRVKGPGNLERFDYWLNTYRYMAAMHEFAALRGQWENAVQAKDESATAAVKKQMGPLWEKMVSLQVAAADTPGEFGTLANLEQHNRRFLKVLESEPGRTYTGPPRLIVPTVRTLARRGETLSLKVIALQGRDVRLYCRKMGQGQFIKLPVTHVARSVYRAVLPAVEDDLEYYIESDTKEGRKLVWPATAPVLNQTVVLRQ